MNEDQLYDAAEREMDLYRAEIKRITAARDEYRDNAILHVRERDEARDQLAQMRYERDQAIGVADNLRSQLRELKEPKPAPELAAVTKGDVIRIIPEKGPERVMVAAHVEHHIITLADAPEGDSGLPS